MKIELLKQLREEASNRFPERQEKHWEEDGHGNRWYNLYVYVIDANCKKYGTWWPRDINKDYYIQRARIRREWILSEVQRLRNNPLDLYNIGEEIP